MDLEDLENVLTEQNKNLIIPNNQLKQIDINET